MYTGITGEPEPMGEKELREASYAIDAFGEPLVCYIFLTLISLMIFLTKYYCYVGKCYELKYVLPSSVDSL